MKAENSELSVEVYKTFGDKHLDALSEVLLCGRLRNYNIHYHKKHNGLEQYSKISKKQNHVYLNGTNEFSH